MMLLLAMWAWAQDNPLDTVPATPEEALSALKSGDALTARRMATEVLRNRPNDYVANYVVAMVYWTKDANLPRALYHYKKADSIYEGAKSTFSDDESNLHCSVLQDLGWVAEEMENSSLFYKTLDRYNESCKPKRLAQRGWRLMKDGRFAEARAVAETALASDDNWQVALGGNVMCALEAVVRDRAAAVVACEAVVERSRQDGYDLTVEAYNASTTTLSALDFRRTGELLELATQGQVGGATNPWMYLAGFELQRGKGRAAVEALQQMQRWRFAQEPPDRAENRAGADATVATVLLAAGLTEAGMRIIDRAIQRPDRRASTTATAGTTAAAHTLLRLAMRASARERQAEQAATKSFPVRWLQWLRSWIPDPDDPTDALVVQGVFTNPKVFSSTFFIYHDDGVSVPVWMLGDVIPLLGTGVVETEIDRQRTLEKHPGIHAYYDALAAEVAWRRDQSRAVALATKALETLPSEEVLLRARVAAVGADQAWNDGDPATAMAFYEQALSWDPGVFRRLGLALPAVVEPTGSTVAQDAADMLVRSPRLTWDRSGFRVVVSDRTICLSTPAGTQLGCVDDDVKEGEDPAAALVDAWHMEAFSLPMDMGRIDMRSLDGTTRLDENARREALENLIGDF